MATHLIHTDPDVLARLAEGDAAAFTSLYTAFYPSLYIYAHKISDGDTALAQDVTAEAFIELWKGPRAFPDTGRLLGFLRTVTHNKCIDRLKAAAREARRESEWLYLNDQQQEARFAGEVLPGATVLTRIRAEVERLPPHTREVFKLAFYERLKNREIAERLQIKEASVRRRKTEALHHLRTILKRLDWELLLVLLYSFYER